MSRRLKFTLTAASLIVAGLLFSAFVLPMIVRSQLAKQLSVATDRKCTVAAVAINPLNWSVRVDGLTLAEKNSQAPFVSLSSLRVRVSPSSIWYMAPVVAELKVTAPYVHLDRYAANSYNFTDILEKFGKKKKSDKPARFSLNNIVIENGRIEFDDAAIAVKKRHTVDKLSVQIPFISSINYFADRYVDPHLAALVNGASLAFDGKVKPFDKGLEAAVNINLKALDIPYYAAYLPEKLPVKITDGTLGASLKISHQLVRDGKSDIHISGLLGIDRLAIKENSGLPVLDITSVKLDIKQLALLNKRYELTKLALAKPSFTINRNREGVLNLSRLKGQSAEPESATKTVAVEKPAPAADIIIHALQLDGGVVRFTDDLPQGGYGTELHHISVALDNFATRGEAPATYSVSLQKDRGEKAAVNGSLAMEPLSVAARVSLSDISLEPVWPYLAEFIIEPVRGRCSFNSDLSFSREKGLLLDNASVRLQDVAVPFGKRDGAKLPLLAAEGGALNLREKRLAVARVKLSGGRVDISRDAAGKLSHTLLLKSRPQSRAGDKASAAGEKPFSWRIGTASISGLKFGFSDAMKEETPRFEIYDINASASSLTGPQLSEMPVSLSAAYAKGTVSLAGRVNPAPLRFRGDVAINSLPIAAVDPYLPDSVNLSIVDGRVDAKMALDVTMKDGKASGSFSGGMGVRDLYTLDGEEGEDLLKWESLALDGVSGTFAPFSLAVKGVSLANYFARITIDKNGRLNLQDIHRPAEKTAGATAPTASQATTAPQEKGAVKIDTVTFSDGILDFTDHHLARDFHTTMLKMGGRVSGLSSDRSTNADIDLRGNLENHSPLKISGKINPLAGDLFLDMQIAFSDIELSPFTPYSGTYLGYAIDKGKLSLALKYKIEHKELSAQNSIFFDQFTFGEKIDSQKATSLPVRLGLALLKDKNGEIHLDLPLSGRTDAPKFSIWGVVGQMLKNLLIKAATSPMAFLQSTFGSSADFSTVNFSPGSSRLAKAEEEKLRSLARALSDRPGLRLEVSGFADRAHDPEGLRGEILLKKMKNERLLASAKEKLEGAATGPEVQEIAPQEYSRWLKAVYEKEKFPRPRTVIGTLKALPDEEMKKLILTNTAVGEQQLRGLARERAVAVVDFLLQEGKLQQERLFEKSGDPFAPPEKDGTAGSRVEFGIVAK